MVASNNEINNTVGASISGVTNTLTIQNPSNTASSSAQLLLTVGGTTSSSPWLQWTVGTTESFALGQNNSASQKLYLNYNNSASVSPTTGTNMFIFDHTVPGMVHAANTNIIWNTSASAVGAVAVNGWNIYELGTFTPTLVGAAVAGTTTYTTQTGEYVRMENEVYIYVQVIISAATGTGDATWGNFPFTLANDSMPPCGSGRLASASWAWPASRTQATYLGNTNATTCIATATGSVQNASTIQVTNNNLNSKLTMSYRV